MRRSSATARWRSLLAQLLDVWERVVRARFSLTTDHRKIQPQIVLASTHEARAHETAITHLVSTAFPADAGALEEEEGEDKEDVLSSLCGFHELEACEWLLAFGDEHGQATIVGMAMVVAYHDSLYVSSLCVLPGHRGCGLGSRIMRSASALAAARGLSALSGSVIGGSARLVRFYEQLGGELEAGHSVAAPGALPPAQRLRARAGASTARGEPPPEPLAVVAASIGQRCRRGDEASSGRDAAAGAASATTARAADPDAAAAAEAAITWRSWARGARRRAGEVASREAASQLVLGGACVCACALLLAAARSRGRRT